MSIGPCHRCGSAWTSHTGAYKNERAWCNVCWKPWHHGSISVDLQSVTTERDDLLRERNELLVQVAQLERLLGRPEEDQPADTEQPPHSQYPDECWCDECERFLAR